MTFEDLLDRLWGFDAETFAHDCLFVFTNYITKESVHFHNCPGNDIQTWLDKTKPILMGYNCNNFDKHILRAWLSGFTPEEIRGVSDYIVGGGNGWDIPMDYIELPIMWDLFNEINPRKSLKEIEGNLRLDITETTIPFDLPTKWNEQQFKEVLYYCEHDVAALFPLFDKLKTDYKSKFIISKLGHIEPAYGLSQTNANLTAKLLKATRKTYLDNFKYSYPSVIDISKIPKEAIDFFNDIIAHNDLDYDPPAPLLNLKDILFQTGVGGGHGFKKQGIYEYNRTTSNVILCNWDFTSLYPNEVRLFGYSSRSQENKQAYVDLLKMRMEAKKGQLSQEFLDSLALTNDDLKIGLKLPLNAYTGALRAKFNELYDNLQGFSICVTGQLIILQLIHDLEQVPTVKMVSANTDAVMFEVNEEYKPQTDRIIHDLEKLTGLEMEEDNIVCIIMRDVNNYCELVQTGENDYAINYKGGVFEADSIKKNLKVKWNKDTETWSTSFTDAIKTNSRSIVGEAILKYLLLDIPVEETIENCNDIFRFQIITHLGSTYEKMVLRYKDGEEVELQRNNRIYAGLDRQAKILKVKENGREDSLPNCPPRPIVDNANQLTIEKIDKKWYTKYAIKQISKFKGNEVDIMSEEDLSKLKKQDLIELVGRLKDEKEEKEMSCCENNCECNGVINENRMLYHKIQEFRKKMRSINFILDTQLPNNLGGGEYASIDQFYNAVQEVAIDTGLDFSFETMRMVSFDLGAFKPATGAPQNIATVECKITLTDIDTGLSKEYYEVAQGSDSIDKAVSGAETLAFRIWVNKNFSPCIFNGERQKFGENGDGARLVSIDDAEKVNSSEQSKPKTPIYVAPEKKAGIISNIVAEPQKTENNADIEKLTTLIYEYRELSQNPTAGANKLEAVMNNNYTDLDIMNWVMNFENAIDKIKKGN